MLRQITQVSKDVCLALLPAVLGIMLCAACLTGGTFAWFRADMTTPTQTLQAARHTVSATVAMADGSYLEPSQDGYALEAGVAYTLTLRATGTVSTGYCIITLTDRQSGAQTQYHTANFPAREGATPGELRVPLTPSTDVTLTVTPQWGISPLAEGELLG